MSDPTIDCPCPGGCCTPTLCREAGGCAEPRQQGFIDLHKSAHEAMRAGPEPRGVASGCEHDFTGWRNFEDGTGGEQVCRHCGLGAMAWSLHRAEVLEERKRRDR